MKFGMDEARRLIALNKETQEPFLDLGNLGLTELPEELWELEHLKRLNLGDKYQDENGEWKNGRGIEDHWTREGFKNQVVEIPSGIQRLPELENLFLSRNRIKDINFLQRLNNLTSLDVSRNQIKDFSILQGLTNLTSLDLGGNQIKDISILQGLTNLASLDLGGNQIKDIFILQGLTNLTSLSLWQNQIKDFSILQEMSNLTSLDLSRNQIKDISILQRLTNLTSLDLSFNKIKDISILQGLTNLTSLELGDNQIKDISCLKELTSLNSLSLGGNQIKDFSFLKSLNNLTWLNLSNSHIEDFSFLYELISLLSLGIEENQIKDISFLQRLTTLTSLDLHSNQIRDISFLQGLTNLSVLALGDNQIKDISILQTLTNLTSLNLSGNQIEDISILQGLTKLTSLNLSETGLRDYSWLKWFPKLIQITLRENKIEEIFFLSDLENLQEIDILFNRVTSFPKFVFDLKRLRRLSLSFNKIADVPYEIIHQHNCLEHARNWFHDLSLAKVENYEVKLLLIGNGRVGKSCILDRLMGRPYDEDKKSTHAIQIERKEWGIRHNGAQRQLAVQIWDFGGQDIYHATHRHFMHTRALYLIVWDEQTEQELQASEEMDGVAFTYDNFRLPYWLDYVRSFSKESPALVVQNKADRDGRKRPASQPDLDNLYKPKDYLSLSAATGKGFANLEEVMLDVFQQMPEVGMEMPLSWHNVRQALLERSETATDIAYEDFEALCKAKEVRQVSRPSLLRYLHDTGAVFYQKDLFGDRIILDQRWAIEAVYLVFDRTKPFYRLIKNKGEFRFSQLDIPLGDDKYSPEKRKVIASFMESCEIIFRKNKDADFEDDPEYIAPELLPDNMPEYVRRHWEHNREESLYLLYEHPILHKAFITRFIVRAGHLADLNEMWRSGIHFSYGNADALVEARHTQQAGVISVRIAGAGREALLQRIRKELKDIYHREDDDITQWVSLDGVEWVELKELREQSKMSGNTSIRTKSGKEVEMAAYRLFLREPEDEERDGRRRKKDLGLRSLSPELPAAPEPPKPVQLFISYAHEDETHKDRLCDELLTWEATNKISIFHDRMLGAGKEIDRTILEEKLRQSDIVCLLVSKAFLKSKYILPKEVPIAMEQHEQDKATVIPIILERVTNYEQLPFGKLASVPDDLNPICGCEDGEGAWRRVNEKVSEAIRERLGI